MNPKTFISPNNSRRGVVFRLALFPYGVQYRLAKATDKKHASRYDASWLGRWTAVDPAGLVDGVNLYMYCKNNPIILNDPNGMESDKTDIGFKFPEGIVSVEDLVAHLSSGGTLEYEGKEYTLSFDSELRIEAVDGISTITGDNLYAHEVLTSDDADDNQHFVFEAVDVMSEDEPYIYDFGENAPNDNTKVVQFPENANGISNKGLALKLGSEYGPGAIVSGTSTIAEEALKKTGRKIVAEEGRHLKQTQKRIARFNRSGREGNYKPLQRNLRLAKTSTARLASGRTMLSFAKRVPYIGAGIEFGINKLTGDSVWLAASKALGGLAGGLLAAVLISNPAGWTMLAVIGLGIGLGAIGSWTGGQIYNAFCL